MKQIIYADNAATTKLDKDAFEAMKPYLLEEYGNASQPYFFAQNAKKALNDSREIIADCIGASPDEIYFTSGGSESDNWAIKGSAYADEYKLETLTSDIEHHAVLKACEEIEQFGYHVSFLPVESDGIVCPEQLSRQISSNTRLVSIMLANNEIGTIQDIAVLSEIAHSYGAIFHTDAVQAVGHIKVDVNELGVDMLSASAHKFNGPKGVGFLYIRNGTKIKPMIRGGAQECGMRAGTENVAFIVGMAEALRKNCEIMEEVAKRLFTFEDILIGILRNSKVNFIRNGAARHIPGNINLSFRWKDGEAIMHRLDLLGICVSTGAACDSENTQVSHVLRAINLDETYAKGTIRISLGRDNTERDVVKMADVLLKILL